MTRVIAHGPLGDGSAVPSYRPRFSLPFGGPLDRVSGVLSVGREAQRELVNLIPREGKVRLRKGVQSVLASLVTDGAVAMDRIVGAGAYETEYANIVVGYHTASRELHVFRVSTDGSTTDHLGLWGTLATGAASPPRAIVAEFQNMMFLAHDERAPNLRLTTHYWNPFSAQLLALEADWGEVDASGDTVLEPLKFRGVTVWLEYLVGWGFGSAAEDRPDMARTSLPGIAVYPTGHSKAGQAAFDIQHFAAAGNPADPITLCAPAGNDLILCKDSRTYPFVGYAPRNFGVAPSNEHRFGVAHANLGLHHMGELYLWTDEGPRVTNGGPLRDLELPLDIAGPAPEDLVAAGALDEGFVVYIPVERIILWVFGQFAYALSLRQPEKGLRWAHWEFAAPVEFGWSALTTAVAAVTASPGHPEWTSSTVESDAAEVTVTNVSHLGDEYIELWLKADGGTWDLAHSGKVELGSTQKIPLTGLASGTEYTGHLRYRRGAGTYDAAYAGSTADITGGVVDPAADWPAVSGGTFTTDLAGDAAVTASWQRTAVDAEQIDLAFSGMDPLATIKVERKEFGEDDSTYTLLTGVDLVAGTLAYTDDTFPTGEVYYVYRVTETRDSLTRVHTVTRWAGPDSPDGIYQDLGPFAYDHNWYHYDYRWVVGYAGCATVVADDYYCSGTFRIKAETAADGTYSGVCWVEQESAPAEEDTGYNGVETPFNVRIWHKLTSFGVDDWSAMTQLIPSVRTQVGEPAWHSCGATPGGTATSGTEPKDPVLE